MSDSQDRRTFLATLGAAAVTLAARPDRGLKLQLGGRKLKHVGLQLYTVRSAMEKDVPGTIEKVAQIGYTEVEFAGYFNHSPDEIRALLAKNKLTSPSSHVAYPTDAEAWKKTVADAKTAGHHYVTVAWTPEEKRQGPDAYKRVADDFNKAGSEAKKAGLQFAYHNHDYELAASPSGGEGALPLDILFEHTDPALVTFEMDLYWMVHGGADPLAYMKKYPGRVSMVHVKDAMGDPAHTMTEVGKGTIDFPKIFAYDAAHGSHIKHAFVEHDQPADPFASIKTSYEYLAKMNY
ncbi:MAG TPA: sugar phosphate isomerase/epimerase [Gemmatimonadaceae bacterium]|jgi:sugar phosphate isomerase/epimerase